MNEKLKPCPFCGGQGEHLVYGGDHWVKCMTCNATSNMVHSESGAVDIWNKRFDITALESELATLRARLADAIEMREVREMAETCCDDCDSCESKTLCGAIIEVQMRCDIQPLEAYIAERNKEER